MKRKLSGLYGIDAKASLKYAIDCVELVLRYDPLNERTEGELRSAIVAMHDAMDAIGGKRI